MQQQIMGQLPIDRIEPSRPFIHAGIDYCGPIMIREGQRKSKRSTKAYVAIFVCFSTKATHLELVQDLTAESFMAALKRFVSRRGKVLKLYSDNATNFKGANKELKELYDMFLSENDTIRNQTANEGIEWHFIPSRSPHFGGLWEAAVKSTKHHLKRVTRNLSLSYVELYTLLTQIEAILNSRPLTPISDDPNDFSFLTPGHFLIGDAITAVPEPRLDHITVPRLSKWQHIQLLRQHFWSRWSREYLGQLQQRSKWKVQRRIYLSPGQLVLLKEDNLPPQCWPISRVQEVHQGPDGNIRVATVLLPSGATTKRALARLVPFPTEK